MGADVPDGAARCARHDRVRGRGVVAWVAVHESGVHATIAGVAFGLHDADRAILRARWSSPRDRRCHLVTAGREAER